MSGRITAIEPQVKHARRYNVYIDNRFALGVSEMLAARLRVGQEMSDAELAQLAAEEEFESAYDRALTFLEQRPRSQAEVRRKLAGKKIAPETIERVIARLTAAGLLNDREFVQLWIESRENFKPRAGQALRMELRQKGVSPALIDEAVKELDEGESAYRAAVTRAPRYHNLERKEFRDKLSAFLLRRGFSYEVVKETVERVWRETRGELVD